MRMFCGFIWVGLDVYAVLMGLWVYKSFLFSCGVLRALTCPSWCIRTPSGCPPPCAGEAKLRPAYPDNAVIILLENTCPFYGQARKSIMTPLPSENETYLVSPACGGDVERSETERARKTRGGDVERSETERARKACVAPACPPKEKTHRTGKPHTAGFVTFGHPHCHLKSPQRRTVRGFLLTNKEIGSMRMFGGA